MTPAQFLAKPARLHLLMLLLMLGLLVGFFRYDRILGLPPGAIHNWRQVDALSMADYFYHEGTSLWAPRTYNLFDGDPHVLSEWPVLYWLTAQIYAVTGPEEWVLRLLVSLHFLSLAMAVYLSGWALFRHPLWALAGALWVLSAPVLLYYGNNYLPDVPALSWAAWGVYAFISYRQGHTRSRWAVLAAFALAGLLKITALMPLAGLLLAEAIRHRKQRLRPNWRWWACLLGPVLVAVLWYAYARAFQARHTAYFLTQPLPIWLYTPNEIMGYLREMYQNWGSFYMNKWLLLVMAAGAVFLVVRWRKGWHWQWMGTALAGLLLFVVMFRGFAPHDYFAVPYYFLGVIGIWQAGLWARSQTTFKTYNLLSVALVGLMGLHCLHAHTELWQGYYHPSREYAHPAYREPGLQAFLAKHGLSRHTPVVSLPDDTPNLSLYLLKAPGWTQFNLPLDSTATTNNHTRLKAGGAQFVALHDKAWRQHPAVIPLLGDSLGQYGPMLLYRYKGALANH